MKTVYLVLDDESILRKSFVRHIRDKFMDDTDQILDYEDADTLIIDLPKINPRPDICILDINMPGTNNGIDALKSIKELCPLAKVYMLTSDPDEDLHELCLANGADEVVVKPIGRAARKAAVGSIIKSARGLVQDPFDTNN